jgi:hypothetical protein
MLDARALIEKHRAKGVLVDTNLLVLFLVGTVNRQRILSFKRTGGFTIRHYDLLVRLFAWFGKLIATPHVLSQVSDLTDLTGKDLTKIRELFRILVEKIEESYDTSRLLVGDPAFKRLGLTDAAMATVCSRGILVLTADAQLHAALQARAIDALSFNHIRPLEWQKPKGSIRDSTR